MTIEAFFQIALAVLFVIAAIPKLIALKAFEQTIIGLGIAKRVSTGIAKAVPIIELIISVFLLWDSYRLVGEFGVLILLIAFLWATWRASGKQLSCNCFGGVVPEIFGKTTVVRILLLMMMDVYLMLDSESTGINGLNGEEWLYAVCTTLGLLAIYKMFTGMYNHSPFTRVVK